ncbi:hypothetical protein BSKO_01378 [Bryopsis sp. KO-2023]|nr:hypothetical protein BSKO_01378 [Bryopsis sp. KO-2023]
MESRGLPPGVVGPVQGQLCLSVGKVVVSDVYTYSQQSRRKLFLRVKFWGDSQGGSCIAIEDGDNPSTATFSIRCDASTFQQYLADMEILQVLVESGERSGSVVGCASVRVAELSSSRPVRDQFPLIRNRRERVGTIDVSVSVTTSATPAPDKLKKLERLKKKRTITSHSNRNMTVEVEVGSVLELFYEFDRALARKRLRLIDVFRTYDRENCGVFDECSLDIMLQRVIDCAVPLHHRQLCWLMIDRTNSGAMTFASFSQGLRESKMACRHVATQTRGVLPALHKVAKQVQELVGHIEDAITLASNQGRIEISHMVLILRELVPSLNHKEERYVIASLVSMQPHGTVSFQDLQEVLCLIPEKPRVVPEDPERINMQRESDEAQMAGDPLSDMHDEMVRLGPNQPPAREDRRPDQPHRMENEPPPASRQADGACKNAAESHVCPGEKTSLLPLPEDGGETSCRNAEPVRVDSVDGLIDRAQGLLKRMSESCRSSLMAEHNDRLEGPDGGARAVTTRHQEPTLLQSALAKINAKRLHGAVTKYPGKENGCALNSNSDEDSLSLSDEPDVSVDGCDGCSDDSSSCGRPDLVAEDALLKSLFFSKSARKEGTGGDASGNDVASMDVVAEHASTTNHEPRTADIKASEAQVNCEHDSSNALFPLRLVIDRVECLEAVDPFIIVRCRSVAPSLVNLEDTMPAADVLIPQPEGIAGGVALGSPVVVVLEVRSKNPNNEQGDIVGIAKAPLAGASDPLAEGTYDIWDIINDRSAGKLSASVHVPPDSNTDVEEPKLDEGGLDQGYMHPSEGGEKTAVSEPEKEEDATKEQCHESETVQHCLIVSIESVHGLPARQDFQRGNVNPPTSYYLEYTFHGDGHKLTTNEVPVETACEFMAKSTHKIPLQYFGDNATKQSFEIQLCCRYPSGEHAPLFIAALQAVELSDLTENNSHVGFMLEMAPCGNVRLCKQNPMINVQVSYSLAPASNEMGTEPNLNRIQQPEASMSEKHRGEHAESVPALSEPLEFGLGCLSVSNRAVESIDSVVCVEILRCTGLLAAVEEAQLWMGGGTSLLGNAHQLGPHPFVTVSLLPESESLDVVVPMIQTSFQAQCFCPVYHHKREVPVRLTAESVRALAEQELSVEVWHHCSRAQAVAARLAEGKSAQRGKSERRSVFLGSASAALHQLLAKPQGIRGWLPLKSRRGEPVGAVQLAIHFSSIGGHHCNAEPGSKSPIEHAPHLVEFLGPQLRNAIMGPLHAPQINSQWIRVTVHIEEALFSSRHGESRPPSGPYHAEYSLPGSEAKLATRNAQAAASGLNLSIGMGGKWRVDWHHSGQHWVKGDARFIRAMLGFPLSVTVYQQTPRRLKKLHKEEHLEKIGCAEIDLSILLKERTAGNDNHRRWLSGSYLLINAASKHLENARVKVRALVDIMPQIDEIPEAQIWEIPHKVADIDSINTGCPSSTNHSTEAENETPSPAPFIDRDPELKASQVSRGGMLDGDESEEDASPSQSSDAGKKLDGLLAVDSQEPVLDKGETSTPPVPAESVLSSPPSHRSMISCMINSGGESAENDEHSYLEQPSNSTREEKIDEGGNSINLTGVGENSSTGAREGVSEAPKKGLVQFDEAAISLQICVEGGLHLVLPQGHQGTFVSFQVKEGQQKTCSKLATAFSHSDGFAAQWESRHEFMVPHVDDIDKITFNVWSRSVGSDEISDAVTVIPQESDVYAGCAVVDLSSLNALKEITGWYNIFDGDSDLKGQLKVSITLDDGTAVVALDSDWFGPEVGNHSMSAFPQSSVGFEFRMGEAPDMETLQRQLAELEIMAAKWTEPVVEKNVTGAPSNRRLLTLSDDDNYVVCGGMVSSSDSDGLDAACPMVFSGAVSEGEEEESLNAKSSPGITSFEFPEPFAYDDNWMFEITKGGTSMPSNVQSNEVPEAWRTRENAAKTTSQGDTTASTAENTQELKDGDADSIDDEISVLRVSEDDLRSGEQGARTELFVNVLPPPLSTSPIQFSDGPPAPTFRPPSEPCSSVEAIKQDENDEGEDHGNRSERSGLGSRFESSAASQGRAEDGKEQTTGTNGRGNSEGNSSRECRGGQQDDCQVAFAERSGDENHAPQSLDSICNLSKESSCKPATSSEEARVPVLDGETFPGCFDWPVNAPTASPSAPQPPVSSFPSNYHQPRSAPFSVIPQERHNEENDAPGQILGDACDQFPSGRNVESYGQALNLSAAGIEPSRTSSKGVKTTHDVPMDTDSLLDKYKIPRQPGWWKSLLSDEARGYLEPTSNWHSNRSNQHKPAQLLHGYEKSGGRASLAFGPDAGHGVPNWRDLIGRNKPRFSGERVDFAHVQPEGNANSVEIPAEGMSEGSKKYIDGETERIAKIMASRWK